LTNQRPTGGLVHLILALLTDGLVADVVERVRGSEPDAIAVLPCDRDARGTADPQSDLDVTAILAIQDLAIAKVAVAKTAELDLRTLEL
jgi:hypothetical protein